jgi:hypothetical protein
MAEELKKQGHKVSISNKPVEKVDVNHHINYESYCNFKKPNTINTLMVTHITTPTKEDRLRESMSKSDMGICMSEETEKQLYKKGFTNLTTIYPAHDNRARRPKMVYIPTNVYPDGCKREKMFSELVEHIDKKSFVFFIMGSGWKEIFQQLEPTGVAINLFEKFDPETHWKILDIADFCLYFGMDEGSMGILDGAHNGVRTIAPNTGFHQEIGIDFTFETQEELNSIFKKIEENHVKDWTWDKYVKEHLEIWEKLKKQN